MAFLRAPALIPSSLFVASAALARDLTWAPVGTLAVLVWLGAALGGRTGKGIAAAALGLLAARLAPPATPPFTDPTRPTEVVGRVCSHPLRFGARSAVELCADRMRRGPQVASGRWTLRLDLPDGAEAPPLGARLRAVGALGRTPGYDNRVRAPAGRWSLRVKSPRFLRQERAPPLPLAWAARAREQVERGWLALGPERSGVALARALALGDLSATPPHWARALRRAGLIHLAAVSGFNVALVAGWASPRRHPAASRVRGWRWRPLAALGLPRPGGPGTVAGAGDGHGAGRGSRPARRSRSARLAGARPGDRGDRRPRPRGARRPRTAAVGRRDGGTGRRHGAPGGGTRALAATRWRAGSRPLWPLRRPLHRSRWRRSGRRRLRRPCSIFSSPPGPRWRWCSA